VSDVGRRISWVVVAAVVVLTGVAAVEAMLGEDSPAPSEAREPGPTTTSRRNATTDESLAEEGMRGLLYYTDEDCRLRAVELPSLRTAPAPAWSECRFSLSADALIVESPDAAASARPPVELRQGAIVDAETGQVLVPARALRRALHEDPNIPPGSTRFRRLRRVEEAAWLDETRLVAILATEQVSGPPQDFIAVFEGPRVVRIVRELGWLFSDLRASPRGSFFAVTATNGAGFVLFDRDGGAAPAPPVTGYRAMTWSPDERWAALATRASVYVFRAGTTNLRLRRLGIVARDLAWRDEAAPRPIPGQEDLRAWAEEAGAEGTLFVGDAGCRLWALRLPEFEWEELRGDRIVPCRFAVAGERFIIPEDVVPQPGGELRAACRGGGVEVYDPVEASVASYPGACAPAWRPDGSLTFIRDGELVGAWPLAEERIVLSRGDLARAIGPGARLQEVAWIGDEELWAVVRSGGNAVLAGFRDGRLFVPPAYSSSRSGRLQASVGLVALESEGAVLIFDGGGRRLMTISGARAISWKPGSRVVAVAAPRELLLVAPHSREVAVVPVYAADVEWR
jgi:hypothetical protein